MIYFFGCMIYLGGVYEAENRKVGFLKTVFWPIFLGRYLSEKSLKKIKP